MAYKPGSQRYQKPFYGARQPRAFKVPRRFPANDPVRIPIPSRPPASFPRYGNPLERLPRPPVEVPTGLPKRFPWGRVFTPIAIALTIPDLMPINGPKPGYPLNGYWRRTAGPFSYSAPYNATAQNNRLFWSKVAYTSAITGQAIAGIQLFPCDPPSSFNTIGYWLRNLSNPVTRYAHQQSFARTTFALSENFVPMLAPVTNPFVSPSWVPNVNPSFTPPGAPQPSPDYVPRRVIPELPDSPYRETGPKPAPVTPIPLLPAPWPGAPQIPAPPGVAPAPNPLPGIDPVVSPTVGVTVHPNGRVKPFISLDPHERRRPKKGREREAKVKVRGVWTILRIVNGVTEGLDFLDALYDALPYGVRNQGGPVDGTFDRAGYDKALAEWRANGSDRWARPMADEFWHWKSFNGVRFSSPEALSEWNKKHNRPQWKARQVYDYWDLIDKKQAVKNVISNAIEDAIFGTIGSKVTKASKPWYDRSGRPVGFMAGPAL